MRNHWKTTPRLSGSGSRSLLWLQSPLHDTGRTITATRPLTENPTNRHEAPSGSSQIADLPHANSHDGITSLLRSADLNVVADKLDGLRNAAIKDPEVPAMDIGSLKTFAEFMLARPRLATKSLGVNEEGFVDAQWFLSPTMESGFAEAEAKESRFWGDGRGMLVLIFLPDGMAHFAANSGPAVGGRTRLRKSATCSLEMIPNELASFWPRVITP